MSTRASVLLFLSIAKEEEAGAPRVHEARVVLHPDLSAAHRDLGRTFGDVLSRVQQAVRAGGTELLRRLTLAEDVHDDVVELVLPNRARPHVRTPVAWLQTPGLLLACLPRVQDAVLGLPPDTPPPLRVELLQRALNTWYRERGLLLEPGQVEARRGDRFELRSVVLDVPPPTLVEKDIFFLLGATAKINGHDALRAVAANLRALPVEERPPDAVPDPRAERLYRQLFTQARPPAIALVGPPGSGRTTALYGALTRLEEADAARKGRHRGVWRLDPNRVIAGQSVIGAWQQRFDAILRALAEPSEGAKEPDVLYVDQPIALCTVGRYRGGALTLAGMLRTWLTTSRLAVVLEASAEEWRKVEDLDAAFAGCFEVIQVEPATPAAAFEMMVSRLPAIEARYSAALGAEKIRRVVQFDAQHPTPRALPGRLIDRLEQAAEAQGDEEDLEATLLLSTGLAVWTAGGAPRQGFLTALRAQAQARVVDQPAAVDAIVDIASILAWRLTRPGKPVASMLFVGPTGVGKTEAARALADGVLTRPEAFVRVDMNEYVDAMAPLRLIGDGVHDGVLTARVRHLPFVILLLDEIEKAHPRVHDLLLQVLDEGRLTDGFGRTLDLTRSVILMTSNVGADEVSRTMGFDRDGAATDAMFRSAVLRAFRPELVNRIDRVVCFRALGQETIRQIARLQVSLVARREAFRRRLVLLDALPAALDHLATRGFDPAMGARALKRTLERELVVPLATTLARLPSDIGALVEVDARGGQLHTTASPLPMAVGLDLPEPKAPTEAAIRRLIDLLDARPRQISAGPEGVVVEGAAESSAAQRLRSLLDDEEEEEALPSIEARVLQRAARSRRSRFKYDVLAPIGWEGLSVHRTVHEWLLDAARGETRELESDGPEDWRPWPALAMGLARATLAGATSSTTLTLHPLGRRELRPFDVFAALAVWGSALGALDASWRAVVVSPTGALTTVEPEREAVIQAATAVHVHVRGPGVEALLADEAGVWLVSEPNETVAWRVSTSAPGPLQVVRTLTARGDDWLVHDVRARMSFVESECQASLHPAAEIAGIFNAGTHPEPWRRLFTARLGGLP